MAPASTGTQKGPRRWTLSLLVAAGVGVLIALVVGFLKVGLGLKRPTEKPISLAGCDVASFVDYAGDAGSGIQTGAPFGLMCQVRSTSTAAPTCDEVAGKYIAAHGTLSKDVVVFVMRGMQRVCQQRYSGDGTAR